MNQKGFSKIVPPQKSLSQKLRKLFKFSKQFNKRGNHRYESSAIAEFKRESQYAPTNTGNLATGQSIAPRNEKVQTGAQENIHKADSVGDEQTVSNRIFGSASQPGESYRSGSGFERIETQHHHEFISSVIDLEIAALNFKSLAEGNVTFEYLLYSDKISRRNDGRLRDGDMRRYAHLSNGGWWCSGIDILTGSDSLWGCLKPNTPRVDENGKVIKYEHPPKVDTEIFTLRIPAQIWELISRRYDVALPENYQSLPYRTHLTSYEVFN